MRILARYVLKEHAGPLVFALTTLTSLLLLNYIAKQFGQLVGKGLPWSVIGEFFLLSVPFTVAMTFPMAVLVSTLYAFSRLAAENEITAMKASGISLRRVMVPVLFGAGAIALGMLLFNDQVLPRSNHRLRKLQSDIARKKPTFALREQVINEVQPGRFFLRTSHLDESTNRMREVTIYDLSNPQARRTIYADSGDMGLSKDYRDLELTLYNGWMQELPKDQPGQLNRLFYHIDRIRVRGVGNTLERSESDTYKSDREMSICEMHREFLDAHRGRARARAELERTLSTAARDLTSDVPAERPPVELDTTSQPVTLGRIYCATLAGLSRIVGATPEAQAAPSQPGAQQRAATTPRLDVPRPQGRTAIPTEAVTGALHGTRARIEDSQRQMDAFSVEIEKKFALAAACIVFVLMGAPIALRFPRGGVGLVIGVSLIVFAVYYVGLIGGESLANRSILPPFWAMWMANLIFLGVAIVLLAQMGREASTARGGDFGEMLETVRIWIAKQGRKVGINLDRRRRA